MMLLLFRTVEKYYEAALLIILVSTLLPTPAPFVHIREMIFRWTVCKSHALVQWIKLHLKRSCGRLSLTAYSLVVNFRSHGVLEGLRSLILKATVRIKLTFACIELRMFLVTRFCSIAFGPFQVELCLKLSFFLQA